MTTAAELINGSLRLLGVLAEGESPSSETANDALTTLNEMLDSWSTERLAVYSTQKQSFSWTSGASSKTIGPTGNFVGNRPVTVFDRTYFRDSAGIDYGVEIINGEQYDSIPLKTTTGSYPQYLWVNMTNPNATLTVYPVPNQTLTLYLASVVELSQPASLSTDLSFPPGYKRSFRYNLACELAPEFGVEPSQTVQRIAMTSKRNLKRINNPMDVMTVPMIMRSQLRFNIYNG